MDNNKLSLNAIIFLISGESVRLRLGLPLSFELPSLLHSKVVELNKKFSSFYKMGFRGRGSFTVE